MQFPRLMYRTPGPEQCQGGSYAHQVVHNADEFEARLDEGWHDTLPEALAPAPIRPPEPEPVSEATHLMDSKANAQQLETSIEQASAGQAQDRELAEDSAALTTQEQTAPPTYDEMKAKAKQLGLEFQGNISKAALLAMITAKLAEQV
ncbi:MAG: hypothetical protein V4641_21575 [Pseudomonadota bacterium]